MGLNGLSIKGNAIWKTTAQFIFETFICIIVSCEKKYIFWRYWRCEFVPYTELLKINVQLRLPLRVTEVVIRTIEINIIETTGDEMRDSRTGNRRIL